MTRSRLLRGLGTLLVAGAALCPAPASAQGLPRMILSLGNDQYLPQADIEAATGAVLRRDLGDFQATEFSLIIFSNIALASVPPDVYNRLYDFLNAGGSLLITGGSQSWGNGGYEVLEPIIPFQIRVRGDWRFVPFRFPGPAQPGHPILAGVRFVTIGQINDVNPKSGAGEILSLAGGGGAGARSGVGGAGPGFGGATPGGGGGFVYTLVAEQPAMGGWVLGIAFDPNDLGGWPDRNLFVSNIATYLLQQRSRIGPPAPRPAPPPKP